MQNKHKKILFSVSQPPGRGGQAGWDKIPSLSKEIFLRLPLGPLISDQKAGKKALRAASHH